MGTPRKKQNDDAGASQVEEQVDAAEDQGFIGEKVDPLPNSAHSLESGPDAPPIHEVTNNRPVADDAAPAEEA